MREILFKAKTFNKEWVEGFLGKYDNSDGTMDFIIIPSNEVCENGISWHVIDENTICQYTGLTSDNGDNIWENDILIAEEPLISTPPFVVRYNQETASFVGVYVEYEKAFVIDNEMAKYCKVVGNLFDNADILK